MAEGMHENDFAVDFCRAQEGSILWSEIEDLADRGKLTTLQSRTTYFARDYGMSSGVVLSLPRVQPSGGQAVIGMSLIPEPGTQPKEFDPVIRENRRYLVSLAEALTDQIDPSSMAVQSLNLTNREVRILHLLSQGHHVQQISDALALSDRTTAYHIGKIRQKLGARTSAQAVARAVRFGIL